MFNLFPYLGVPESMCNSTSEESIKSTYPAAGKVMLIFCYNLCMPAL